MPGQPPKTPARGDAFPPSTPARGTILNPYSLADAIREIPKWSTQAGSKVVPAGVVALHAKVARGLGDAYFGEIVKVVRLGLTPQDQTRWPLLNQVETVYMIYKHRVNEKVSLT